jgi:hypothetical protein
MGCRGGITIRVSHGIPVKEMDGIPGVNDLTKYDSWGQTSNRTDFYKVPLIAVASVILALAIVAGIIL